MIYDTFRNTVQWFNEYDYKTQAIIATLIVQTVPVVLMSMMYSILTKYVTDTHNSGLLMYMYSFTFGALMGDVFFHIFPSIYSTTTKDVNHAEEQQIHINLYIIGGIVICYFLEVVMNKFFHHEHHQHIESADAGAHAKDVEKAKENKKMSAIAVALLGDFFHNFTDGLAMASTFTMSTKLGLITTIA